MITTCTMGWNIELFLNKDTIDNELICAICTDVLQDPVQTECEHTFCKACIDTWLEGGRSTCPVDRKHLTSDALKVPSRLTKQLLSKLILRCKNYENGCRLMAKLEDIPKLKEHEAKECSFSPNTIVREYRIWDYIIVISIYFLV